MNHDGADPTSEENIPTPWDAIDPTDSAAVAVLPAPMDEDESEVAVYRAAEYEQEPAASVLRKPVRISLDILTPASEPAAGDTGVPPVLTASVEQSNALEPAQPEVEDRQHGRDAHVTGEPAMQLVPITVVGSPVPNDSAEDDSPTPDAAASFPLAPVLRGEGRGEGPTAQSVGEAALPQVASLPLTPTLSPEYRGEGTNAAADHPTEPVTHALDPIPLPESDATATVLSPAGSVDQPSDPNTDSQASIVSIETATRAIDDIESDETSQSCPTDPVDQLFAQAIAEADVATDDYEEPDLEMDPAFEDPEMCQEPAPLITGASWTIPLLCLGIAIIACCVVIPQADANRRLAYEKQMLQADYESVQKQVAVNDEFLKKVVDDPSLAERLAQRQLKRVRKGQRVLHLKEEKPEMSPFQITNIAPPPPLPAYKPVGGVIATLCYDARVRLYLMGAAMVMMACALVMGSTPGKK